MKKMNEKGFTLIELVLVITILAILAIVALPQFIDISTNAAQASRDGTVGAVREGIALFRANDLVINGPPGNYPTVAVMDTQANGPCVSCFSGILQSPLNDPRWTKTAADTWTYNDGTAVTPYTYAAAVGNFQ